MLTMDRKRFDQAAAKILSREHENHGIGTLGEKTLHAVVKNYVEPDISVICDKDKIAPEGCKGSPDWIIEIVSPGNPGHDYIRKLQLYADTGVREYWIVDYRTEQVFVYCLEQIDIRPQVYTFHGKVKVNIYDDFWIDFEELDL